MRRTLLFLLPFTLLFTQAALAENESAHLSCDKEKFWVDGEVPLEMVVVTLKVENGAEQAKFEIENSGKAKVSKNVNPKAERNCEMKTSSFNCRVPSLENKKEYIHIKAVPKTFKQNISGETSQTQFDADITVVSKNFKGSKIKLKKARCLWQFKIP